MRRKMTVAGVLILLVCSVAIAAVSKFTFENVTFSDGNVGTIRAGVKTTKNGSVTVCGYFAEPNDQYLGQFEGDNAETNPAFVRDYCLAHYADRAQ